MALIDRLNYIAPESVDMALDYLLRNDNVAVLAGGTDVVPQIKYGIRRPRHLLNLDRIGSFRGVQGQSEGISMGAMVTLKELTQSEAILRHVPAVAESARQVASPQIRNMATLGGNLLQDRRCLYLNQTEYWRSSIAPCLKLGGAMCHQVPNAQSCRALYYSDLAPALLAYDARVEVYDAGGKEILPLEELIHRHVLGLEGPFLLSRVLVPYPSTNTWGTFLKYSVRASIDFPTVNVAVRYSPLVTGGRQDPEVRIFVGAVGPEPLRLREVEDHLMANLWGLHGQEEEIRQMALKEVANKSGLIRETAVALQVKKNAMQVVCQALDALFSRLSKD